MRRRICAMFLTVIMLITLIPMSVFADGTVGSSGLVLSKTAKLESDGTYTIDLEAYSTGATTTITREEKSGVPLDIVMVIDQSGSMAWNDAGKSTNTVADRRMTKLKTAVTNFANNIAANAQEYNVEHRISLVGFASDSSTNGQSSGITGIGYNGNDSRWVNTGLYINGTFKNYGANNSTSTQLTTTDYKNSLAVANDGTGKVSSNLASSIGMFKASGGTMTEYGLIMANNVLKNADSTWTDPKTGEVKTRKKIVVVFTDGETNSDASDVLNQTNTMKNSYNATVYTIGFGEQGSGSDDINTLLLSYMSSNYKGDAKYGGGGACRESSYSGTKVSDAYAQLATNASTLNTIFENISKEITEESSETTVTLKSDSIIRDVIAEEFDASGVDASKDVTVTTFKGSYSASGAVKGASTSNTCTASVSDDVIDVTGFDFSEKYIASGHAGEIVHVTIKNVLPKEAAATGAAIATNKATSGIYANATAGVAAAFFPQPETIITNKAYVLDYAKTANLGSGDLISVYGIVDTFKKVSGDTVVTGTYGSTSVSGNALTYQPTTMNWNGYDTVCALGTTSDTAVTSIEANANGNVWSKVSIIPANNVYYDDDFITSESNGIAGIEYTGDWTVVKAAASTEVPENAEDTDYAAQGWIDALDGATADSNGGIHSIEAAAKATDSKATFTFSGTGFDIYGRTNNTSGTIMVRVSGEGINKSKIIDTSSNSGEYYQIPTCSFSGLAHGSYTVTILVTKSAKADKTSSGEDRYMFYMDGIRIYNPVEEDETVQAAYGADETNAVFTQVRDALQSGAVFIDEDENGNPKAGDYNATEYGTYGPKNEVYLKPGQSVTFMVDQASADNTYYVGMKAPEGSAAATVTVGDCKSSPVTVGTSDLYYKITPSSNGEITINNSGSGILSLTKIKTCGTTAQILEMMDVEPILAYAQTFATLVEVPYENEVIEETPVEEAVPDVTAPADDQNINDVVVENPVEEAAPAVTTPAVEKTWIANLLSKFAKFFR